jgi:hypothetical protein
MRILTAKQTAQLNLLNTQRLARIAARGIRPISDVTFTFAPPVDDDYANGRDFDGATFEFNPA